MESNRKLEAAVGLRPLYLVVAVVQALNQTTSPALAIMSSPVLAQHQMIDVLSEQPQSLPAGALL